ncbi:SDR family NAD(P)-dependent oxidoreductase [Thalassotalea euphylliae]|uniref:SDR family NAD(P)-dependent oxidoreductase n=1 Tax=Thalassotalea euphylliae TaxID=1655234 RepID=A0A3E0UDC4_9GAMM|nr:SDR family NAD(P)-dependent oxidoreductase [Thalassotalea euphylliae]REL34577.1 SDR family NAD(P)-dependent oxidoreductase [Thalassotalea euphylliae]
MRTSLVIGASSAIAQAVIAQLLNDKLNQNKAKAEHNKVIAVSRQAMPQSLAPFLANGQLTWRQSDYQQASIQALLTELFATLSVTHSKDQRQLSEIIICNGILHSEDFMPEKKIEAFEPSAFDQVLSANTLTPLRWLQALMPYLEHYQAPCFVTVMSARIGSISDNQLGGWYSYRMSKAALNMAVKCLAIEASRRAKHVKFILFHPGTTDTPLSKPFQRNVRKDKLFTPAFVATQLLSAKHHVELDGQASYLDWQHKVIPW